VALVTLFQNHKSSLQLHLLYRLILVSVALVGGSAMFAYIDVKYEANELFDAQLARSARVILSIVQSQDGISGFSNIQQYLDENGLAVMYINFEESIADTQEESHIYETKLAFQIWDREGNLVVKSYNAPLEPFTDITEGYNNVSIGSYEWRTFSLPGAHKNYRCITAERIDVREDLVTKISRDLLYMFIVLVPLLSLIIYITTYSGLRPLRLLAAQINRRSSENLELLSSDSKYEEIQTIQRSLNRLLTKLYDTLEREKRFTSDAAHELRTPLAAIRLHTELAKSAKNTNQKDESLEQVLASVDRATHMVEQLLALARLEPDNVKKEFSVINLSALIADETAQLLPLALEKNIEIEFDEHDIDTISGNETALRLLIRNLIKNAVVYTPEGGNVSISIRQDEAAVEFVVEDNGPGISEDELKRVTERFYRSENHDAPGCGIGLSIVERVVQVHGGQLRLACPVTGKGLKAIVRLSR
jgi:two-component system sensor histidine kinase QseC